MSLLSRLYAAVGAAFGGPEAEPDPQADAHLAVVALLAHVARVDGRLDGREHDRLAELVAARYGGGSVEADAMIERAVALDDEVRDLADLAELAARDADPAERQQLLEMAWTVAAADGTVHEFEDALVARLAQLLRLDEAALASARAAALGEAAVAGSLAE